jgi:hypothetical protein
MGFFRTFQTRNGQRLARLRKIDMAGQIGKTHGGADIAPFVEERLPQLAEAKTAAEGGEGGYVITVINPVLDKRIDKKRLVCRRV